MAEVATPPAAEPAAPAPSGFEEAFGAIDAMGRDENTPPPPDQPPPGDGRVRGPDGKFLPKGEKPPEKKEEPPKGKTPEPPKEDDIDPSKLKTSELAKHYHKLKAEQKEWLKKQQEYETKLKTPPEWPEKKTYEERLAEHEKKIEEYNKKVSSYEQELQFTNFTKSQLYKDQYEKPLIDAYNLGQSETATLEIVERTDAEGNVIQKGRDATAADFDAIMKISDNRAAVKMAVQLFGDGAAMVLAHRNAVKEKNQLLNTAVEEYRTKGTEREKAMREQQEKHSKEFTGMVEKFRNAAMEKWPEFLKPDDADPKSKELLERGAYLLNRVLNNGAPLKDGDKQWTGEEVAQGVASVRNMVMSWPRVAYLAKSRGNRIKELEKELEQYKSTVPGNGAGKGRETPPEDEDDPLAKIEKLGREH